MEYQLHAGVSGQVPAVFQLNFCSRTLPTKAGASSSGELHLNAAGSIAGHQAEDVRDQADDVFHAPGKLAPSLGPVFLAANFSHFGGAV